MSFYHQLRHRIFRSQKSSLDFLCNGKQRQRVSEPELEASFQSLYLIKSLNPACSQCTAEVELGWVFNCYGLGVTEFRGTKEEKGKGILTYTCKNIHFNLSPSNL